MVYTNDLKRVIMQTCLCDITLICIVVHSNGLQFSQWLYHYVGRPVFANAKTLLCSLNTQKY